MKPIAFVRSEFKEKFSIPRQPGLTSLQSKIEFVSYDAAYSPGFEDMRRRKPVIGKLEQTVGFHPVTSLRATIELTAAAMR